MWDHRHGRRFLMVGTERSASTKSARRLSCQPSLDALEARPLMTASLQAITNVSVPALQGSTVPLLANSGATDPQTFTVTSSNPDITASIAQGPFWTLGVSYNDSSDTTESFTGSLTFQLFQNLTPNTVSRIEQFTNDGYYTKTGMYFPRIVTDFDSPLTTVIQGGASNNEGTGSSGQPNTPYGNENVQELALTGVDQLAMANSGGTDSNGTQFFINTGPADGLGYNYTVVGQLVAGQTTLNQMATQVAVQNNPATGEDSQPVNPLTITSASLSATSPDGVVILNTTAAKPGETATITVTATDPADGTTATQSFNVVVGDYVGPTTSSEIGNINFAPYANPISESTYENVPVNGQLSAQNTYPVTGVTVPLTYSLAADPDHGTITNFNASTGTFTYTPDAGYVGADTFTYDATAYGPNSTASPGVSRPTTVTVNVAPTPPVVNVQNVTVATNKRGMVTQLDVAFNGPVNTSQADKTKIYRLVYPNRQGAVAAGNAAAARLRSAMYNTATDSVTLTLSKPLALKARALDLVIDGTSPSGLEDVVGRYLDGADNGQPGSNAVVSISKNGVSIA
jgi:cyclophilin family peptidyl-prolyl cis-trans isomerase